jgi:hypothetical protein
MSNVKQSESGVQFPITLGDPEDFRLTQVEGALPEEPAPTRGLALLSLKLKRSHEGWFSRLFRDNPDEIFIVSIGLDLSGEKPFVWPQDQGNADKAWVKVSEGETHEFKLGDGYPIYLPRQIVGGLALSVLLAESDSKERAWWKHVNDAVSALNSDAKLIAFVAAAATNPASITVAGGLAAAVKATEIVSKVLSENGNDNVGAFQAILPASGDWDDKLAEDQPDVSIVLAEVRG